MLLQSKIINEKIKYTGNQLRSHWIYEKFGILGDAIIAFTGECDVSFKEMVDLTDVLANDSIYSLEMLHFIVEHFDPDLEKMILRQRLLVSILQDILNQELCGFIIKRQGDDLYDDQAKLSVSIATITPVSCLIHLGLNIKSENTPVLTKGLLDYKINWEKIANLVIENYKQEYQDIYKAKCKVRWVK